MAPVTETSAARAGFPAAGARRQSPVQHDLIWGSLALTMLVAAWAYPFWQAYARPFMHCRLKEITGIPCFLCGGTHAMAALMRGEPLLGLAYNPLATLFGIGALIYLLAVGVALARRRPLDWSWVLQPRRLRRLAVLLACAVIANWIYLICARG